MQPPDICVTDVHHSPRNVRGCAGANAPTTMGTTGSSTQLIGRANQYVELLGLARIVSTVLHLSG